MPSGFISKDRLYPPKESEGDETSVTSEVDVTSEPPVQSLHFQPESAFERKRSPPALPPREEVSNEHDKRRNRYSKKNGVPTRFARAKHLDKRKPLEQFLLSENREKYDYGFGGGEILLSQLDDDFLCDSFSEDNYKSLQRRFCLVSTFIFFFFLTIFGAFGIVAYQAQFWLSEPKIKMGYMKKVDGIKLFPTLHADLLLSLNISNPNWLKLTLKDIKSHVYYKHNGRGDSSLSDSENHKQNGYHLYIGEEAVWEEVETEANSETSFDTQVTISHKFSMNEYMNLLRDMQSDCKNGNLEFEVELYNGTAHILWFDWPLPHTKKSFHWKCPDDWSPYTAQLGPMAKVIDMLGAGGIPDLPKLPDIPIKNLPKIPVPNNFPKLPDGWKLPSKWPPTSEKKHFNIPR